MNDVLNIGKLYLKLYLDFSNINPFLPIIFEFNGLRLIRFEELEIKGFIIRFEFNDIIDIIL